MTPGERLRKDLLAIVRSWLFHDQSKPEKLADAMYDFVIETYGPPF